MIFRSARDRDYEFFFFFSNVVTVGPLRTNNVFEADAEMGRGREMGDGGEL